MTILCADRDPIDVPLKGVGKLSIDSNCKGYSRAALLQPLRTARTNASSAKEHRLAQIPLHNECCEELGTEVNISKINLNLKFQQTVSHADDIRYAGIKVRDLEKHVLEHEWKEKHLALNHGYSTVFYILLALVVLYIVIRLILCLKSKGTCRKVAGVFKFHPAPDPPSGNVINTNIKTSNESLAFAPENVPLRELPPSGNKNSESETRTARRLRSTHSYF